MSQFEDVKIADFIKRKRRRAFFWGAGISALIAGGLWAMSGAGGPQFPHEQDQIASIRIDGGIGMDSFRDEMMAELSEREDVRAVIVNIDSGGGGIYASERLYKQMLELSQDRPVVAVMEGVAASGAYITAIGTDHIIAGETTVTGSIGVIYEIPDVSEALGKLGIGSTLVRSSDSKGGISPIRKPTDDELADAQELLGEMYNWFHDLVGERRGLSGNALAAVTGGTVMTGKRALDTGLIDELGGFNEAMDYLIGEDARMSDLPIEDWVPLYPEVDELSGFIGGLSNGIAQSIHSKLNEVRTPTVKAEYNP